MRSAARDERAKAVLPEMIETLSTNLESPCKGSEFGNITTLLEPPTGTHLPTLGHSDIHPEKRGSNLIWR